jgi:hypothetical protein
MALCYLIYALIAVPNALLGEFKVPWFHMGHCKLSPWFLRSSMPNKAFFAKKKPEDGEE